MAGFLAQLGQSLLGIGSSIGTGFMNEYFYNRRNRHLTGKEQEQNAFNAQQAQINRDWEEQMSNTANQRAVTDMTAAGLNPALMYGNGSAASTPTGSNAQGSASLSTPTGVENAIAAYATLKNVQADVDLKRSQAELNRAKAQESAANKGLLEQNTVNAKQAYDLTEKNIEGAEWDNKTKELAYNFNKDTYDIRVEREQMTNEQIEKQNKELDAKIEKCNQETKNLLAEYDNIVQQYNNLIAQEELTYAQASEAKAMLEQIHAMATKLTTESNLTQKDIDSYTWNHAKTGRLKAAGFETDVHVFQDGTMVNARDEWHGSNKQRRQTKRQARRDSRW